MYVHSIYLKEVETFYKYMSSMFTKETIDLSMPALQEKANQ